MPTSNVRKLLGALQALLAFVQAFPGLNLIAYVDAAPDVPCELSFEV